MQPVASATQSPFFSLLSQIQNALTVGKASGVQTGLGVNGADKASGLLSFPSPLGTAPPLDLAQQSLKAGLLAATLTNKFTRDLDFDAEFNSAFKPSFFSNPPTLQNPLGLAQGAVNLATGIFNKTSASKTMSAAERATLFLMLMNGANMGLKGAAGLLQQAGALTGEIKQALNRLRTTIQLDLQNFYGGARAAAFDSGSPAPATFSNPVSTAAATAEQPAAPAETPSAVTGIGPLTSAPAPLETQPVESQPVVVEAEPFVAEAEPSAPETEAAPPVAPAETPHPILSDPAVQAFLNDLKNNRQRFQLFSGTFRSLEGTNLQWWALDLMNFETPNGTDHSLFRARVIGPNGGDFIIVDGGSEVFEEKWDYQNGGVVSNIDELYSKLDAQPLLTVENPAGQTFQIQSLFENGKVEHVEVNGMAMTSAELVQFAKDNGFETRSVGSNVTEYIANSKTPLGDKPVVIAAETASVAMNRQQYLYENNPNTNDYAYRFNFSFASFIKDQNGKAVFVEHKTATAGLEMEKEFRVDGREMTAEEFLNSADSNLNFRKVSYEEWGRRVEVYIGEETVAGGVQSVIVGIRIDGQAVEGAFSRGAVMHESIWKDPYNLQGYHNDPFELIANQDGKTFEYGEIQIQDDSGRTASLKTLINGEEVNDQQLLEFAKSNNFQSVTLTANGQTLTEYFSSNDQAQGVSVRLNDRLPVVVEVEGVGYNRLRAMQEANAAIFSNPEIRMSPIVLDLEGDGIDSVSAENGVQFDLLGTGQPVQTGWVTGDDALLALDRDGNGVIDSGKELFGNQWGAANGFEELAKFDENADSVIDSRDAVFGGLRLWRDVNMNGVSEAGEMKTLKESRLGGITITYNEVRKNNAGNEIRQVGSFTREDGSTGTAADIWFRFQDLISRRDLV